MTEQQIFGQHIFIKKGMYSHHGVYVGASEVIHYSGFQDKFKKGAINKVALESFLNEKEAFVRVYFNEKFSQKETVKRAYSRLGEESYHLIWNNCEHFAAWCVTGRQVSSQVKDALLPILGISRGASRQLLGWAFNINEQYVDFRMKHFLKHYQEIIKFL